MNSRILIIGAVLVIVAVAGYFYMMPEAEMTPSAPATTSESTPAAPAATSSEPAPTTPATTSEPAPSTNQ